MEAEANEQNKTKVTFNEAVDLANKMNSTIGSLGQPSIHSNGKKVVVD